MFGLATGVARGPLFLLALLLPMTVAAADLEQATDGLDASLQAHVNGSGLVDYQALAVDRSAIDSFTAALEQTDLSSLEADDRLATLINAYNAFALQTVLEHYPIEHVLNDLEQPFDAKRWMIGGEAYSLNEIENDLIRAKFDEPRIHWAVNCAAVSCPPLRAEAYRGDRLETQLAEQEERTLDDEKYVKLDGSTLRLTRLFEWYEADFVKAAGSATAYVAGVVPAVAEAKPGDVEFMEYDWTLNDANR